MALLAYMILGAGTLLAQDKKVVLSVEKIMRDPVCIGTSLMATKSLSMACDLQRTWPALIIRVRTY
ncbi:hypothetical protein I2I11_00835 [Pontibacter sp. 172403-2]|uniref:hypothetical protein n=1 Tax=Pontibacter rufus TaxID=2791028 RepID=UPI0018AF5C19|nr:hypothetical protein [Pontibacter sp. 172403-2]MBF9251829.1 hypothetical protein [Pontibacter sp. 172403-2]